MILVLARSRIEYRQWLEELRDSGDRVSRAMYVTHETDLLGWNPCDVDLVYLPYWYEGFTPEHIERLMFRLDLLRAEKELCEKEEDSE